MKKSDTIAYLTSRYPALSHTFVQREIAGLRKTGQKVLTTSIRRSSGAHTAGAAERIEERETFYVLEAAPRELLPALLRALARPARFCRAVQLAWRTRAPGAKATLWQLFYLLEAVVLSDYLRRNSVHHLHCHFANSECSVAMLTSILAEIPYSFTLHGPDTFFEPYRWRLDEKIERAKFVACISDFCRSQAMIFASPGSWEKMKIVHCGVDPERYGRIDRPAGNKLIFVGRLAVVKGVAVLLHALAELSHRRSDWDLTLIGDGPERANLEKLTHELGLSQQVFFAGAKTQEEVADALANSDLFLLPSFAEGVPVVLMEAMASRLPVVTTRIAGIPELVEHEKSGLLVPPGNVTALSDAIRVLLEDEVRRVEMGKAGRKKVVVEFDVAKEAVEIGKLFSEKDEQCV